MDKYEHKQYIVIVLFLVGFLLLIHSCSSITTRIRRHSYEFDDDKENGRYMDHLNSRYDKNNSSSKYYDPEEEEYIKGDPGCNG